MIYILLQVKRLGPNKFMAAERGANGNLLSDGGSSYSYNTANRRRVETRIVSLTMVCVTDCSRW